MIFFNENIPGTGHAGQKAGHGLSNDFNGGTERDMAFVPKGHSGTAGHTVYTVSRVPVPLFKQTIEWIIKNGTI